MIVDRLINADWDVRLDFVNVFHPENIRICDNCGAWMLQGYYLTGKYACSEDCAAKLYFEKKDWFGLTTLEEAKNRFLLDLEEDEENGWGDTCEIDYTNCE